MEKQQEKSSYYIAQAKKATPWPTYSNYGEELQAMLGETTTRDRKSWQVGWRTYDRQRTEEYKKTDGFINI